MFTTLAQLDPIWSSDIVRNAVISIAWIFAVLALAAFLRKRISKNDKFEKDTARRWLVHTRNAASTVLVGGLIIISEKGISS